jgi:hypothetical protein
MHWFFSVVLCSALLVSNAYAASPGKPRDGGIRIRPQDARSTQMLRDGMARSETFRNLVDRIEASNVFVYVAVSPFIRSSLAGQLTWMTKTGPYRYLRATLSPEQSADQAIATLAHELQHAVEVVEDERVTNEKTLVALYKRIGEPSRATAVASGWETVAAQEAGYRVRRELVESTAFQSAARLLESDHL